MPAKILVTPRSLTQGGHPSLHPLSQAGYELVFSPAGRQPTEAELMQLVPGCVGYLAGVEPVTARVLQSAPQLRVISRNGTGVDNVDLDTAQRLGIQVLRAEGANARGVAELAVGLIFSLARAIPFSDRQLKADQWQRRQGIELEGKTLGLVGCGRIGKLVAQMALGLDMNVVAYDLYPDKTFAPGARFRFAPLEEVIEQSDILSLHSPAQEGGRAILDRAALSRLRPGALVVNTARASLIDPQALLEALKSGQVAGAALDVFEVEPPVADPLVALDNVIATPHTGSYTRESTGRLVEVAVDNLLRYLQQDAKE